MAIRFIHAFLPESFEQLFESAGLLTYSLFSGLPVKNTVAKNAKKLLRAYSSGNCTGFSPVSLLIPQWKPNSLAKIEKVF